MTGYLILDDSTHVKRYAQAMGGQGRHYSSTDGRTMPGVQQTDLTDNSVESNHGPKGVKLGSVLRKPSDAGRIRSPRFVFLLVTPGEATQQALAIRTRACEIIRKEPVPGEI